MTMGNEQIVPAPLGPVERMVRPGAEAPRWWHCDTHGPGKLNAWGCPDCVAELRRWKSTHAPRLAALEGLLHAAQHEAWAGREAVATLASERAANALLTDEVERLRYQVAEWEKLGDPVTLHANLLRGIPCRLDRATFLHLAGDETPNV